MSEPRQAARAEPANTELMGIILNCSIAQPRSDSTALRRLRVRPRLDNLCVREQAASAREAWRATATPGQNMNAPWCGILVAQGDGPSAWDGELSAF